MLTVGPAHPSSMFENFNTMLTTKATGRFSALMDDVLVQGKRRECQEMRSERRSCVQKLTSLIHCDFGREPESWDNTEDQGLLHPTKLVSSPRTALLTRWWLQTVLAGLFKKHGQGQADATYPLLDTDCVSLSNLNFEDTMMNWIKWFLPHRSYHW